MEHRACHCCGMIHRLPSPSQDVRLKCTRCGTSFRSVRSRQASASRTAAAALAALILFWPAILLPVVEIEKLGQVHRSSILGGILELFAHGSYFIGGVVLLFSIVFPLTKIILLLELSLLEVLQRKHNAWTLRLMEHLGKWSMMDVLLLALLVMLIKVGEMVEFHLGPAASAFVLCVAASMLASLSFDPHAIWEEDSSVAS